MAYRIENGIWQEIFAIPCAVTDQHIKLASGLSIKVLLLLLRHRGKLDIKQLAKMLAHPVSDIQDAVNYWVEKEILFPAPTDGAPVAKAEAVPTEPEPVKAAPVQSARPQVPPPVVEKTEANVTTLSASRKRLTTEEINDMAKEDTNIAYLLQETQAVMGKPLTPVATDTVTALYSYYGMEPGLILMLIHYCTSIGKGNMRYIEKMAASWLEKGIDTHEKAETEIKRLTGKEQAENKVKKEFGIYDRSLITSEKKYIQTWTEDFGMDIKLIVLAYERTVELKGKLSFPYINGILSNWHEKGILTVAQAMQEIKSVKKPSGGNGEKGGESSSYDIDELEKMITYGSIV